MSVKLETIRYIGCFQDRKQEIYLEWPNVESRPPVRKNQDPLGTTQRHNEQELVGTHRQYHWCAWFEAIGADTCTLTKGVSTIEATEAAASVISLASYILKY